MHNNAASHDPRTGLHLQAVCTVLQPLGCSRSRVFVHSTIVHATEVGSADFLDFLQRVSSQRALAHDMGKSTVCPHLFVTKQGKLYAFAVSQSMLDCLECLSAVDVKICIAS